MLLMAATPWWDNPEFWVTVAFVILVAFALRQGVVGMITKALDDRAQAIRNDIEEARRLRTEAQALLDDSKRKHAAASDEAAAIVAAAKQEAESLAAQARQSLAESIERRTRQAEDKIARAEAQAVAEVRATSADVAVAAAEQLIKGQAGTIGGSLIDQGIRGLKERLN